MNSESTYQKLTDEELIHLFTNKELIGMINFYDKSIITLSLYPNCYNKSIISYLKGSIHARKLKILKDHC